MIKKILFAHELSSSSNSRVVQYFRDSLNGKAQFIAEDLPLNYNKALALLQKLNKEYSVDMIVGVSMGGMFAHQIDAPIRLLVNPAFHVSDIMKKNMGLWPWSWKRNDGETNFEITEQIVSQYSEGESQQFDSSIYMSSNRTIGLFALNDELVNCKEEYLNYYDEYRMFSGGHYLTQENVENDIVPIILNIL